VLSCDTARPRLITAATLFRRRVASPSPFADNFRIFCAGNASADCHVADPARWAARRFGVAALLQAIAPHENARGRFPGAG